MKYKKEDYFTMRKLEEEFSKPENFDALFTGGVEHADRVYNAISEMVKIEKKFHDTAVAEELSELRSTLLELGVAYIWQKRAYNVEYNDWVDLIIQLAPKAGWRPEQIMNLAKTAYEKKNFKLPKKKVKRKRTVIN